MSAFALAVFYAGLRPGDVQVFVSHCLGRVLCRPSSWPCSLLAFVLAVLYVSLYPGRFLCHSASCPCSVPAFVLAVFCVSLRPSHVLCQPSVLHGKHSYLKVPSAENFPIIFVLLFPSYCSISPRNSGWCVCVCVCVCVCGLSAVCFFQK